MHLFLHTTTVLAVALPFVFPFTQAPNPNFWPLMATAGCVLGVWGVWWCQAAWQAWHSHPYAFHHDGGNGGNGGNGGIAWAQALAQGLLLGAMLGSAVGLVQYFQGDPGWQPWISGSVPGQSMGNLRQRNQQASLISLGVWALFWLLAQWDTHTTARPKRGLPAWLVGLLATWALAWLALGSAATASRTGLVQWGLVVVLLACWWRSLGRWVLGFSVMGLGLYLLMAWFLPQALLLWAGVESGGLFHRFGENAPSCTGRRALWANVVYLIAQKPWLGWGWGELDYAHYITLFPGERFCTLLDHAHNLPLHLAVELGLPFAILVCGVVLGWVLHTRPWHETQSPRQLAWGILVLVGLHSLLEFPLWYGPFQWVTALAVGLLLWEQCRNAVFILKTPLALILQGFIAIILIAFAGYMVWDYHRLVQVFMPVEQRSAGLRDNTLAQASRTLLFSNQADFAVLTTTPITLVNAAKIRVLAHRLLHFSPEPKVIQAVIESATLLGLEEEAALHVRRYQAAFPEEFARWAELKKTQSLKKYPP